MENHDDTEQKKSPLKQMKRYLGEQKANTPGVEPTTNQTPAANSRAIQAQPQFLTLPVVPIREGVLFPHTESVLTFGRPASIKAITSAQKYRNLVVLVTQRKSKKDVTAADDLYRIGTLAIVDRTLSSDGQINALIRGISRVYISQFITFAPMITALVKKVDDVIDNEDEVKGLGQHLSKEFRKSVQLGKAVEFLNFMKLMGGVSESELVDQVASTLTISTTAKQQLLETTNVQQRLEKVIDYLAKETKVLEIEKDVANKTQKKFDKHMRENVLRERLRTIQKELGEDDDEEETMQEYEKKLKAAKIGNKETLAKIKREVKKLRQMSPNNPESGYLRTWLDTIVDLPWSKESKEEVNLSKAEKILNKNHYGLEKVKERILEYIAVLQFKKRNQKIQDQALPTILCFVGPPGVGKTSIGKSIAESLNRKFVKVSLGGIHDEAEIRGHRRTYIGSMPGRIIAGIQQAGSKNPVFMLDEVDKVGNDFRGDPSAALLEALDPEQNHAFEDHYIDSPFDLSRVLFITTANTLDTIPPALRDRLEIVPYTGYTEEEKFHIAKQHLWAKVLTANGLSDSHIRLADTELDTIISRYTREAGVRELERMLSKVARKSAKELLANKKDTIVVDAPQLTKFLGPAMYDVTSTEKTDQVGLATGLAWTSVGGEMLFIEVALTPGKGTVQLTGKLGDVMKESAQAALTYVKANAPELGIDPATIEKHDVHVHIPEGAVPKDGPSAGITMTTAIVSAFTKKKVKRSVAMTGEVTLRGNVLRIGGLKEKVIAAHRAGSKTVIIPKENERDLEEIPESVKKDITFHPVSTVREVLELSLVK